jgi:ABC-type spermidine/putrescine transport system permease subunit II
VSVRAVAEPTPLIKPHGWLRRVSLVGLKFERTLWIVVGLAMSALLVWIWFPIVDLALMSVNGEPFRGIPNGDFTTDWYRQLFQKGDVGSALWTSVKGGVLVAAIVAVGAFFAARSFQRLRRKSLFLLYVLLPLFVPGLIFGFGILVYSDLLGWQPGWMTIIIAHLSWAFPFSFLAMLIATSRLDSRLLEAAADLGASRRQILRDVELPLLRPGLVAAFLFAFLLSFNELVRTIFVNGQVTTLPVYVWAADSSHSSTVPITYALTTLIMLASLVIIACAYWLLFRSGNQRQLGKNV